MSDVKCGICHEQPAKYRCPKCSVRYCSLACYKDIERHNDEQREPAEQASENREELPSSTDKPTLNLSPELQELLRYNTVKFHLAKVYRILKADVGDSRDPSANMTTDMKRQLAIDYLNTLRVGGIHHNEAIEEFCEHSLRFLEKESTADT